MSYKVKTTNVFEKQAKRLIKKYVSLKAELLHLVKELKENPEQGTFIGKSCFKIRIAIASKGKGKSGGARIIANAVIGLPNMILKERSYPGRPLLCHLTNSRSQAFKSGLH